MNFCFRINHLFFKEVPFKSICYKKALTITALSLIVLSLPAQAKQWSEKKFDKTVLSIDKDLRRERWVKVIERSQKALPQCIRLYSERASTCIFILKNINQSYEKTAHI